MENRADLEKVIKNDEYVLDKQQQALTKSLLCIFNYRGRYYKLYECTGELCMPKNSTGNTSQPKTLETSITCTIKEDEKEQCSPNTYLAL